MKKILKALGIATLAAAVIPCKVEKDEETGVKTYQSLLSRLRVGPGEDGEGTSVSLDLLDGVLPTAIRGKREDEDYADDELDLETVDTEPVFEMSFKVEREVPAGDKCETCDVCDTCETPDACADCEVCEACDAPEACDDPEACDAPAEPAEETTKDHGLDL